MNLPFKQNLQRNESVTQLEKDPNEFSYKPLVGFWSFFIFSLFCSLSLAYIIYNFLGLSSRDIQLIYDYPTDTWIRFNSLFIWLYAVCPFIFAVVLLLNIKKLILINNKLVTALIWIGMLLDIMLFIGIYQIIRLNI